MAHHVGERLLREPEEGGLDLGRQRSDRLAVEARFEPGAKGDAIEQPVQRFVEPGLVEDRGPQLGRELAHGGERTADQIERVVERVEAGMGKRHSTLQTHQVELRPGEELAELVVELARDPPPFVLLGGDQAARHRRQTLLVVVELVLALVERFGHAVERPGQLAELAGAVVGPDAYAEVPGRHVARRLEDRRGRAQHQAFRHQPPHRQRDDQDHAEHQQAVAEAPPERAVELLFGNREQRVPLINAQRVSDGRESMQDRAIGRLAALRPGFAGHHPGEQPAVREGQADRLRSVGLARDHGALVVHQGDGTAHWKPRQRQVGELLEDRQVERGDGDRGRLARGVGHRMGEADGGRVGGAIELILADREFTAAQDLGEVGAVDVEARHRNWPRAADHLALEIRYAEVAVHLVVVEDVRERLAARRDLSIDHLGQVRDRDQHATAGVHDAPVLGGHQIRESGGLLAHCVGALLACFACRPECERQCRERRHQKDRRQPGAERGVTPQTPAAGGTRRLPGQRGVRLDVYVRLVRSHRGRVPLYDPPVPSEQDNERQSIGT